MEKILETIATQGLLGCFLVLALGTIFYLYKECRKEKDSRIEDLKSILESSDKYKTELKGTLDIILEILRSKK